MHRIRVVPRTPFHKETFRPLWVDLLESRCFVAGMAVAALASCIRKQLRRVSLMLLGAGIVEARRSPVGDQYWLDER